MSYLITITQADGHVFNNAFATVAEAREFLSRAALVLLPGETLSFNVVL